MKQSINMTSVVRLIALTTVIGLFGLVQAQAQTSLATLLAGGSLTCGNLTFENFNSFSSTAGGPGVANAPTSSQVFGQAVGCNTADPTLQITSGEWNVNQNQSMSTSFSYDVFGGTIGADLELVSGSTTGAGQNGGDIHNVESIFNPSNTQLGSLLTDSQQGIPSETVNYAAIAEVVVNQAITLEGNSSGTAAVGVVDESFLTPEPTSISMMLIGGMLITGVAICRRRAVSIS